MNKYLAEGFGTFFFVLFICGSILANAQTNGALGMVGIALVHAFALAAVIYATAHISGAHLNPAITVAQTITGHLAPVKAVGYIIAQLLGAVAAAVALKFIFAGVSAQLYLGDTQLGAGVSPLVAAMIEALFTFALTWVVYGAGLAKKSAHGFGGLAIGMVLAAAVLVTGHLTMTSLNPARSFGPAFVSMHWENHFVYWIGPLLGAIMSGTLYHFVVEKE